MFEENPKRWHEVLSEALWAHRISKHSTTKVTSFELVYEQEAILPVEVNLNALWIARQNELSTVDYHNLILDRLDEVSDERVKALGKIERDMLRVPKAYNKRVKENRFKLEILFGRWFCLLGLEVATSTSGLQIGEDRIVYKGPHCQGHLTGST
jgi:hypothetical protein